MLVLACLGSAGKYAFELFARGNAEQLAKVAGFAVAVDAQEPDQGGAP